MASFFPQTFFYILQYHYYHPYFRPWKLHLMLLLVAMQLCSYGLQRMNPYVFQCHQQINNFNIYLNILTTMSQIAMKSDAALHDPLWVIFKSFLPSTFHFSSPSSRSKDKKTDIAIMCQLAFVFTVTNMPACPHVRVRLWTW